MIDAEAKAQGPYTTGELLALLKAKQIPESSLIAKPGGEKWEFVTILLAEEKRIRTTRLEAEAKKNVDRAKPETKGAVKKLWRLCLGSIGVQIIIGLFVLFGARDASVFVALQGAMGFLTIALFAGFLYFLPSAIAFDRKKRNLTAIMVLNLFLGWTLLGWVGAMIWAVKRE